MQLYSELRRASETFPFLLGFLAVIHGPLWKTAVVCQAGFWCAASLLPLLLLLAPVDFLPMASPQPKAFPPSSQSRPRHSDESLQGALENIGLSGPRFRLRKGAQRLLTAAAVGVFEL